MAKKPPVCVRIPVQSGSRRICVDTKSGRVVSNSKVPTRTASTAPRPASRPTTKPSGRRVSEATYFWGRGDVRPGTPFPGPSWKDYYCLKQRYGSGKQCFDSRQAAQRAESEAWYGPVRVIAAKKDPSWVD